MRSLAERTEGPTPASDLPHPESTPGAHSLAMSANEYAKLAAMGSSRSHSDIEVLQSSNRSKLIALGGIVAIAGAGFYLTRGGPIGAPEEGSSIMIVTKGSFHYRHSMEEYGFKVLEQRQDAFVEKAIEMMPELAEVEDLDDVTAILQLADFGGYGYVAFENPEGVDFSKIEVDGGVPEFVDANRFAVVSAGDFAFPHVMTVTPERSDLVPGIDLDLLTALFAQEPLHSALTENAEAGPSVLVLANELEMAIERVSTIDEAAKTIAKIEEASRELLIDQERGRDKPALLGSLHESVHPIALADGGVLIPSRTANFTSKNGLSADLSLDDTWRFFYQASSTGEGERVPCEAVLGGAFEQTGRRPRFRQAPSGDALLFDESGTSRLFVLPADAAKDGTCQLKDMGVLPRLANRKDDPGTPHRSGWVARSRHEGNDIVDAVVELQAPGDEPPLDLLRSTRLSVSSPVWLDADHLAVVSSYREGDAGQGILLLSRNHPGVALEIGPQIVAGSYNIFSFAAAPKGPADAHPRLAVISAGPHASSLFRVDLPADYGTLFTEALAEAPATEAEVDPEHPHDVRIITLDATRFEEAVRLTDDGSVANPAVSADGKWVTYTISNPGAESDSDYEIGLVALDGQSDARLLTQNGLDDHSPVFSGDSKRVVFKTKYPIERTTWSLTTGRSLPVE